MAGWHSSTAIPTKRSVKGRSIPSPAIPKPPSPLSPGTSLSPTSLGNQLRQVTLFSASDFGRTLTSNGDGSDHAWGGNQFVMGGGVIGKNLRYLSRPRTQLPG